MNEANAPYDILQHPWDTIEEILERTSPPVPEKCHGDVDHKFTTAPDCQFLASCEACGAWRHTWARLWEIPY